MISHFLSYSEFVVVALPQNQERKGKNSFYFSLVSMRRRGDNDDDEWRSRRMIFGAHSTGSKSFIRNLLLADLVDACALCTLSSVNFHKVSQRQWQLAPCRKHFSLALNVMRRQSMVVNGISRTQLHFFGWRKLVAASCIALVKSWRGEQIVRVNVKVKWFPDEWKICATKCSVASAAENE